MLDNHCIHCNEQIGDGDDQPLSSYDFVYLPIDFKWFSDYYAFNAYIWPFDFLISLIFNEDFVSIVV